MKVFFIGTCPLDDMGGDTMEAHVVEGLKGIGADTFYFQFFRKGFGHRIDRLFELAMTDFRWIESTPVERSLLRAIREFKPDVVLMLLGNYVPPMTVHKIRGVTSAAIVCWCQDHMGTMGRQYIIGSKFDYVFSKDRVMVDVFRCFTRLKQVHYLPEACNPRVHRPVEIGDADRARFGCDVTTAATLYYFRSEIFESLFDLDMRIWGPVPRFYDGPLRRLSAGSSVYARDKAACFGASKVVLNSLFPMEFGGINARAFEVAGCGGFQIITHTEAIAGHFEPGKELETFSNLHELREKVLYYLKHDLERNMIAEAGCKRAHAEHTYEIRLGEMLRIIGS